MSSHESSVPHDGVSHEAKPPEPQATDRLAVPRFMLVGSYGALAVAIGTWTAAIWAAYEGNVDLANDLRNGAGFMTCVAQIGAVATLGVGLAMHSGSRRD